MKINMLLAVTANGYFRPIWQWYGQGLLHAAQI